MTNMSINIATLPIQTLHELHQGISYELCIREKRALLIIKEVKTNNQQMFVEKVEALQACNEVIQCNQQLEASLTQVCSELPELQIPAEATSTEKIHKLVAALKEPKEEIGKVWFELQLQILEFQMKLQQPTPPEVREQCKVAIKEDMTTMSATVKDYNHLFEQTMEMWASLQKDTHLQNIEEDICNRELQFDELQATMRTLAPVQRFAKLQVGKTLQAKIDELH